MFTPQFQQFGNTMFPIRNVVADPLNPITSPENQYFGLASAYEVLNVRASLDFNAFDGLGFRVEGDSKVRFAKTTGDVI